MEQLIEEFVRYLVAERGSSDHTIRNYRGDLSRFQEFLEKAGMARSDDGADVDVSRIDSVAVRSFLGEFYRKGNSASSMGRHLSTIRSFFRYLCRMGTLRHNVAKQVNSPKTKNHLPHFLPVDEAFRLVQEPGTKEKKEGSISLRDRAILELFYATGIRVGEMENLSIGDFEVNERILRVRGKGKKMRLVPVGKYAVEAITKYLDHRKETRLPMEETSPLFLNRLKGRMSSRAIYNMVQKYARRTALPGRISPHSLRHTFATYQLEGGANIRDKQELLGKSSLSTTQK